MESTENIYTYYIYIIYTQLIRYLQYTSIHLINIVNFLMAPQIHPSYASLVLYFPHLLGIMNPNGHIDVVD